MTRIVLSLLRFYFRTLARIAPRTAGRHAYRLFSTPRRRASVPSAVEGVMDRAERFDIESGEYRVAAYRWTADSAVGATPPRIMLVHGWESRAARMAVWVDPLLDAGFEVVAFDAPAHGASTGRRANPMALTEAMWAVIERVGLPTACVGHSLGGFASLLAVAGGRLIGRESLAAERLVILAGAGSGVDAMAMFCDVLGLSEGFLPLLLEGATEGAGGLKVADFDAHRLFGDYPVPTLWLHDPEDDEVPFEAAERVARVCPHVTLERIEDLGHHRIVRDPAMITRGLEFLADLETVSQTGERRTRPAIVKPLRKAPSTREPEHHSPQAPMRRSPSHRQPVSSGLLASE